MQVRIVIVFSSFNEVSPFDFSFDLYIIYKVARIQFKNFSIRGKLLIPLISLLLGMFIIRELFVLNNTKHRLTSELDAGLQATDSLYNSLIHHVFRESLKHYLRGRAEDAIYSFEAVFNAYKRGSIPLDTAMRNINQGLISRKVGSSGYYFVMDLEGKIIFHPISENIGKDFSSYAFIQKQLENYGGYSEYQWSNPGDSIPREKAMYTQYFPLMDWIIAVTAYKEEFVDLLDMEQLGQDLFYPESTQEDIYFIINSNGEILFHPELNGYNVKDREEGNVFQPVLHSYLVENRNTGTYDYSEMGPSGEEIRRRLHFSWLPEFDFAVVSSIAIDNIYQPVRDLFLMYITIDVIFIILVSILIIMLTNNILRPLRQLTATLIDSPVLSDFNWGPTRDELKIVNITFEHYVDQLDKDKANLKRIAEENQLLAKFPSEMKLPVLRVNKELVCCFLNDSALRQLYPLKLGQNLASYFEPQEIFGIPETEQIAIEKVFMGNFYRIFLTDIPGSEEKYLHFYNLTSEKKLTTLESIWHHVFDSSIEGITITDEKGTVERINKSFTQITGYSEQDILGKSTNLLKSMRHDESFYQSMWQKLLNEDHWEGEIWNRKKSGEIYIEWLSISAYYDSQTGLKKYMAIFHDISEIYNHRQELEFANSHDLLTRLPNRSLFTDRLQQAISMSKRNNSSIAVAVLDIYRFKSINENMGLEFGDLVLKSISQNLEDLLREGDTVARLGSDDFGLLLTELSHNNQSVEIISRIQKSLEAPLRIDGKTIKPVFNIGISLFPHDGANAERLIAFANAALNKAKLEKPGTYSFFDNEYNAQFKNRFELEEALKNSLEKGEFLLHYQPKVSLQTGELEGFEALIRWNKNKEIMVSPMDFIPILEENGLIVEVGYWVIEEVCKFICSIKNRFSKPFRTGINISAKQFNDPEFLDGLLIILEKYNVKPEFIDLEITENIAINGIEQTIKTLKQLRGLGFSISIDDFGTGYSSLKYFKDLSFDYLKIDKSFVDPLPGDKASLAIVKSIVTMAKNLNKKIVVEGIEKREQGILFYELKCDQLQGYYFSKPLNEEKALDLAEKMNSQTTPLFS